MDMSFGTPISYNANVIPTCPFQFLFSSITLAKKLFSDFPILEIFFALLVGCIFYRGVIYIMFQSLEEKYKWVRREWRLLNALIKDVECISKSAKEIGNKARQLWDVELSPELIVRLHQTERAWVETTKKVVGDAEICVKSYQRLSERGEFLIWSYSMFWDWIDISNLDFDFDRIKDAIDNLIMKREKPLEDLYGSLERSRSIVRSLHDRPIKEDRSFVYTRVSSIIPIERILNDPIDTNPGLVLGMQEETESIKLILKLLLAFLRDLEGLRLESETEKAWVDEAEEIIREIQYDTYSVQTLAHPMIWFSYFINLTANLQRRRCKCMETVLRDLFKRKEMYGFTFIRRDPSKSFRKQMLPPQAFDDVGILALVDNIRNYLILEEASTVCASKLRKLSDRVEKVHRLFRDAKAFEGVKHSRMASLRTYRLQIINWLTFSTEIERFFCALELLEISLKACRIELREETNLAVGLEEDIHKVVSGLTTNGQGHSTLCIVGMRGIGKTTLAKIIYNNKTIRQHFEVFAWVSLTDSVAEDSVLKILGQQVLGTDTEWNENEFWIQSVRDFLLRGRYILVLDNIRTKNDWDNLKGAFPETTNGSRIVVTTKYRSVASYADPSSNPYQLRLRTKDESWCLFTQIVLFQPQVSPEEKKISNKVVGRCGGLPLSILHLGFLMLGENVTIVELSRALEHMRHYQTPWLETKKMNDEDLSLNLKRCLSYFAHFPKDSEIPVRRLTALWAAEGLAEHSGDGKEPLEHAERSLSELINRNLIQVVKQKHNGEVKTCGFPTALRELWLQSYCSKITPTWSLSSSLEQRLVCHLDEKDLSCSHTRGTNINSPDVCRSYRNLHSILIFDTQAGYKPGEDIGNFFSRGIGSGHLLQLHVLDLEHVFQPQLPNTIGTLIHLIYLGLRWTYLKTIPSSIGKLKNLQTLDLKHTYIRILPSSVWKLQKLQHLYMNEIHRCKIQDKPRCNFLKNLRTLWGAFVDKDSPLKDGLYRIISLRKLKMAIQLNLSQQQELAENLVKMRHLQTLKLKSIDEMGWPQNLKLCCLSGLENLSNLYLFGKLETPSIININGLPRNLTELSLSASRLSNDPMPELEKLHQLKLLSFYFDSYIGTSMVCSSGGFPQLQVLRLWMLNVLEEWKVEEQAMPELKNLEIRSCEKLMVPTGLRHLKTLRELKLKDMALEFNETIETKDQIWGDIAHAPAIIIETKQSLVNAE